jgi:hypothetical protein
VSDLITSIVRDTTGKIVGALVGLALAAGVTIPADMSAQATAVVSGALAVACQIAYYVAVRAAEQRWPAVGRLLGAARAPAYGIEVPIHTRLVVDHEATMAEALRVQGQVKDLVREAQQGQQQRR